MTTPLPKSIRYQGALYVLDDTKFDGVVELKKVTKDKAEDQVDSAKDKTRRKAR